MSVFLLCALTRCLRTVYRWGGVKGKYDVSGGRISEVLNESPDHPFGAYAELLHSFRVSMFRQRVKRYTDALYRKTGVLDSCFEFMVKNIKSRIDLFKSNTDIMQL